MKHESGLILNIHLECYSDIVFILNPCKKEGGNAWYQINVMIFLCYQTFRAEKKNKFNLSKILKILRSNLLDEIFFIYI